MKRELLIKKVIEELRQDLNRATGVYGLNSPEVLLISKKLDQQLNSYYQIKVKKNGSV